ncbi:MAG: thioredoxin family protein [Bacteroidetes bacterium]|nr:thioredoxin family protein [Bacteroidota bacterium]
MKKINLFLANDNNIVIDYNSTKKANKFVLIFGLLASFAIISVLFIKFNHSGNKVETKVNPIIIKTTIADSIRMMYDYTKQNTGYKLSFLEFGSTGCRECKMMEKVMYKVKTNFTNRIQVVFYNVTQKENKAISKHFGIQMIPVQILLDSGGTEVFRHLGFLSYKDLCLEFNKYGIN